MALLPTECRAWAYDVAAIGVTSATPSLWLPPLAPTCDKGVDIVVVLVVQVSLRDEKFRDFATHDVLAAADRYDNGTTQVLIAKPN